MHELGVVYRNIRRADGDVAARLGALGVATAHEQRRQPTTPPGIVDHGSRQESHRIRFLHRLHGLKCSLIETTDGGPGFVTRNGSPRRGHFNRLRRRH